MATGKVHWGKPIWGTAGGAEQPVTYSAIALMLVLAGPGKLSLDALLGTRLPNALALLALAGAAGGVAYGLMQQPPAQEESTEAGPPADQEHEPQTETGSGAL
jgi:putative oxidoreductase